MKHLFCFFLTFALVALANISDANAQQVNAKIQEVYGVKTQEMVTNDPERLALLIDLLENRIKIVESVIGSNEKYPKLSEVAIVNKYNPSLTRDVVFDPLTFNPLKYNLNILPVTPAVYRVDNTNYLIVIQPQTIK